MCDSLHWVSMSRLNAGVAVSCKVLQCAARCCSVLQGVAVCCKVLQGVAVRCSVLQCVCCSVCCSVCNHLHWLGCLQVFRTQDP